MKADCHYSWRDRLGNCLVRWNYGRNNHSVIPGLYAIGNPSENDLTLVTANYKFSFDMLRRELTGLNVWILVLDTKGINVWCAAGKGTFGTAELINRINSSGLSKIVKQRLLILPQLGAPGVSAHEVLKETGFRVVYGPVRARDLPVFLKNGLQATEQMREVTFTFRERIAVIPVELITTWKYITEFLLIFLILDIILGKFSSNLFINQIFPFIGAILSGVVIMPVLMPYLPVRSFTLKGIILGMLWGLSVSAFQKASLLQTSGNILLSSAISGMLGLNFTGCTPIASQSGVKWEIKVFAKPVLSIGIVGILLQIYNLISGI
ncbi:MAG: acetyl-CoA synthase subunit gamma [Candidatus Riflebacteria bacterium]|nr:acetyl-CoA synthase subunit gamma [Candidatus Riflebacteria bacterium]